LQDILGLHGHTHRDIARSELVRFFSALRIELGPDGVGAWVEPLLDGGIELLDFGVGPFDLSVGPNKRILFHDIDSIMAKDDLKETKALMGALVRMKPKPHEYIILAREMGKTNFPIFANSS
jgi:hypothetical protein